MLPAASGVDIQLEGTAPARAVIAARGATKENSNFTVGNYSATFYTLARIFDVGNQFLRQSRGAAEKLTRSRLARLQLGRVVLRPERLGTSEPLRT